MMQEESIAQQRGLGLWGEWNQPAESLLWHHWAQWELSAGSRLPGAAVAGLRPPEHSTVNIKCIDSRCNMPD